MSDPDEGLHTGLTFLLLDTDLEDRDSGSATAAFAAPAPVVAGKRRAGTGNGGGGDSNSDDDDDDGASTTQTAETASSASTVIGIGDNVSRVVFYGLCFNQSLQSLLTPTDERSLKRTRSGKKFSPFALDPHSYFVEVWLAAHGIATEGLAWDEIAAHLTRLGVEVGEWGPNADRSYAALATFTYTFHAPAPFDWELFRAAEKGADVGALRKFCATFGISFETPEWHQVGIRW